MKVFLRLLVANLSIVSGALGMAPKPPLCTQAQVKALKAFERVTNDLGKATTEGGYGALVKNILDAADELISAFPSERNKPRKHLFQMKAECGEKDVSGRDLDEFGVVRDFFNTVLFPGGISFDFNDDKSAAADAKKLLGHLISMQLLAPTSFAEAMNMVEQLFVKNFPYSIGDVLSQVSVVNDEDGKKLGALLERLLNTYGANEAIYLTDFDKKYDWLSPLVGRILKIDSAVATDKDGDGKTILHRFFEKQFTFPTQKPASGKTFFEDDQKMLESLGLKQISGIEDENIERTLSNQASAAAFIKELAYYVGKSRDKEGNSILHVLRKNRSGDDKDTDARAVIEYDLVVGRNPKSRPIDFLGGRLSEINLLRDAKNMKPTEYPLLVHKSQYEDFMNRYTKAAFEQFGASLDALAKA